MHRAQYTYWKTPDGVGEAGTGALTMATAHWRELEQWLVAHECSWTRNPGATDTQWGIHLNDDPPHNRLLGPVFERGPASAVLIQNGRVSTTGCLGRSSPSLLNELWLFLNELGSLAPRS